MVDSLLHHSGLVLQFYRFLDHELSFNGGTDQYNLITSTYEAVKKKESSFSFPPLEKLLVMNQNKVDREKITAQRDIIQRLVKQQLHVDNTERD